MKKPKNQLFEVLGHVSNHGFGTCEQPWMREGCPKTSNNWFFGFFMVLLVFFGLLWFYWFFEGLLVFCEK